MCFFIYNKEKKKVGDVWYKKLEEIKTMLKNIEIDLKKIEDVFKLLNTNDVAKLLGKGI